MIKRIKNSTILFLGLIIIFIGICFTLYEYFEEKKNNTFSKMNIILYENEFPENIIDENNQDIIIEEIDTSNSNDGNNEGNDINQNNTSNNTQNDNKVVYNYKGILEIPKINLKRGFFDLSSNYNNVSKNVTVINGSTFPDEENNNLILAAHSGNCSICYFDKLYKLSIGDIAYINYNGTKYTYKAVNIYNVDKNGTVAIYRDYKKNTLTLITCTRNSDTEQTVYIFELDK